MRCHRLWYFAGWLCAAISTVSADESPSELQRLEVFQAAYRLELPTILQALEAGFPPNQQLGKFNGNRLVADESTTAPSRVNDWTLLHTVAAARGPNTRARFEWV